MAIRNVLYAILLLPSMLLCLGACSGRAGDEHAKPNFLIFIADDLSWYDLGCYGNEVVRTPNIDEFASESMHFMRMFTPTAMCSPSRSAMYTGLYPHRNGCHMNHGNVFEGTRSIPHYLQPLGYRVALAGKRHIKPRASFPFDYLPHDGVAGYLEENPESPFCIIYASNDPHGPHEEGGFSPDEIELPPIYVDTERMRRQYANYYTDIEIMDREFQSLLDILDDRGLEENTLVVFTSDHGFEYFAKWSCYEAGLRSAFILRWPGAIKPGSEVQALTSYVDVLPTLIDLAGGAAPGDLDGRSMADLILGKADTHHQYVYGAHTNRGIWSGRTYPIRAVRDQQFRYIRNLCPDTTYQNILTHGRTMKPGDASGTWKSWLEKAETDPEAARRVDYYLHRPAEELYDLEADPWELNNLADDPSHAALKSRLSTELDRWMEAQGDGGLEAEMKIPLHFRASQKD